MKSVLIIETPNNCQECKYICMMHQEGDNRPAECPLRPLPKPAVGNIYSFEGYENGKAAGWNRFYDEITGQEIMHNG